MTTHEDVTVDFYNKESSQYSEKRYNSLTETYFQFLFKRRRQLFLDFVGRISKLLDGAHALEIGCADGVIVKKLLQKFPNSFASITGIDISPKMIEEASRTTEDSRAAYFVRGDEPDTTYEMIIELGVHAHNFEGEMQYISNHLKTSGYLIYSASGKNSLHAKIKLQTAAYRKDYLSYSGYEKIIQKYFSIVATVPYGLFVPKLWAFPRIARVMQPVLEALLRNIFPGLFHEKIYLLKKKLN
jgi:SAM-dependent methyltransferase